MKPTVYIETTIPSLLTARPSRDVEIAAQQVATREWWETRREGFELYVSPDVLDEAGQGNAEAARLRLEAIADLPVLAVNDNVEELTRRILETGLVPHRATRDAAHIAFASVHGMDFLLTWNCRHIHNAMISRRLSGVCSAMGFTLPVLCTPRELMIH
ncbi:MAG: type II toxin-antitoxin system VapC family toxin [Candidatus Competibacteraceae bacterium]|nr:type II toxin-antitoxin system VapC family toxin [Candidatus Competibacteraceae bacterium]